MKHRIVGGLLLFLAASPGAFAADIFVPPPQAPPVLEPPATPYTWNGCYLGANGGAALENDSTSVSIFDPTGIAPFIGQIPTSYAYDREGWLAGGQLGCNFQASAFVVGVETDFDDTGLKGGQTINTLGTALLLPTTSSVSQQMSWMGTTRARLGVAWNNVLLYGTGGVAYAQVTDSYSLTDLPAGGGVTTTASDAATLFGWTAGGGLEVGFGPLSVRAEALYYDLGNHNLDAPCTIDPGFGGGPCAVPNTVFTARLENQGVMARVGLNYRLGYW